MPLKLLIQLAQQSCCSLSDLPARVWSNTDHVSPVMLCRESDLEHYGCAKVFTKMLVDLKTLRNMASALVMKWSKRLSIVLLEIIWGQIALVGLLKTLAILGTFVDHVKSLEESF